MDSLRNISSAFAMLYLGMMVLVLTAGVEGDVIFRHQFQSKLRNASADNVTTILGLLRRVLQSAPDDAKPHLYQIGKDLGVASTLYSVGPGTTSVQADIAGVLDFASEDALRAYFAYIGSSPVYSTLLSYLADAPARIQYVLDTCGNDTGYNTNATIWRHSFMYKFKNNTLETGGQARLSLNSIQQRSPIKPLAWALHSDLAIGPSLYATPAQNYDFGGVLDFDSLANLQAWWKWHVAQPDYQAVAPTVAASTRIQYHPTST